MGFPDYMKEKTMGARTMFVAAALAVASLGGVSVQAAETIYGSQLMTRQERIEHRNRMREMKTEEERNAYRLEHHKRMQERAREKGVTLPDSPPPRGGGKGRGMGPGMGGMGGMGPGMGGGMGPGMGGMGGMGGGRP